MQRAACLHQYRYQTPQTAIEPINKCKHLLVDKHLHFLLYSFDKACLFWLYEPHKTIHNSTVTLGAAGFRAYIWAV